ncbi:hypothetical protein [Amphritea atlantica]|uniref:hypothetical protein n=1 Tax=Amphritea atlantica TaxID=355243 RepID=UPI001113FF87|nr:hypothetical protein [Amphritea atlantica]
MRNITIIFPAQIEQKYCFYDSPIGMDYGQMQGRKRQISQLFTLYVNGQIVGQGAGANCPDDAFSVDSGTVCQVR